MADTLERDHIDAALSLLRADTGLTVYPDTEGLVPKVPADHYVRVFTEIDRAPGGVADRIDGDAITWVVRWYCHCVGPNEYSATAVAGRVRVALMNVVPAVTGRTCGKIRQDASQPTIKDESTGTTVYDRVLVYRTFTSPA